MTNWDLYFDTQREKHRQKAAKLWAKPEPTRWEKIKEERKTIKKVMKGHRVTPEFKKKVTDNKNGLYTPFDKQIQIHDALKPWNTSRIVMAITGRRFGKTTLAVNEIIDRAMKIPASRIWYIAHTEKQAYRVAWRLMLYPRKDLKTGRLLAPYLPEILVEQKREDQHWIRLRNGSWIELLGTVDELPMLGAGLNFVVFDEFPAIPWTVWFDTVSPMLLDFKSDALFIGTVPDPKRNVITPEFIEMYESILFAVKKSQRKKAFNFTSYDNPHLDKNTIKMEEEELIKKGRGVDAERLYGGKYTRELGLVFPKFSYEKHTCEPFEIPKGWMRAMAVDPHPQKPIYALWVAIDPRGHMWFYREMEFTGQDRSLTVQETAYEILCVENESKEKVWERLIDPTYAKQEHNKLQASPITIQGLFKDYGLHFKEANRDFMTFFNRFTDMLVEEPESTVHVFRSCVGFIDQVEHYMWESWASSRAREEKGVKNRPKKINDDYVDNAKYLINSNLKFANKDVGFAITAQLEKRWANREFM